MAAGLGRPGRITGLTDRLGECAALGQLTEAVRAGVSRALVACGDPGVGKTALLGYLAGRASGSGCQVVRATGVQSEIELAFAGLHQLCAPMLKRADRLPAPQRDALRIVLGTAAGPPPDRFLVGLAVLNLLSEVAAERPLICVAVRSGDSHAAARALERLAETAQAGGTDFGLGFEARCRALVSEPLAAEGFYREATERLGGSGHCPELARALLLYGEWLRRERRCFDARDQLRTAHDVLTTMGMAAFAKRARRELAATGEVVPRHSVETITMLTAQEDLIARPACDGRTNPEIGAQLYLSARTAEWHLRKAFTQARHRLPPGAGHRAGQARTRHSARLATGRCACRARAGATGQGYPRDITGALRGPAREAEDMPLVKRRSR